MTLIRAEKFTIRQWDRRTLYGEIEYSSCKVLQRWRGSGGNVHLSHLLMSGVSC